MISIITATYNRAYILPQLYKSLLKSQKTYSDFEWVIVDDGSTDDTKDLVEKWIDEKKIKVRYYKQKNGGKMSALNYGIPKTKGEIIIEVDSDDYLNDTDLKTINDNFSKVENDDSLYGILFRRTFSDKKLDAKNSFPFDEKVSTMFDLYMKSNFDKDACIVFKGDIRRKFSHKLENNEKFVTEARMYNEMDKKYKGLLCINKPIIVSEYLEDGYSKNIEKLFINNPHGYYHYFKECLEMNLSKIPFKKYLYLLKHYILFSYLTKRKKAEAIKNVKGLNKLMVSILIIPGYYMSKKRFGKVQ